LEEQEAILLSKKYLPYRTLNHHLGLDTHDVGSKVDSIKPNMVITCEPGIYIPEEGIGFRLEDDIVITGDGYINLSRAIPL
jgi:Xaa-Pro aminopeptidase